MMLHKWYWFKWLFCFVLLCSFSNVNAQERQSTLEQQQALAVTIYNNDLALVKDTRRVQLTRGYNELAFRDVSALIRPETAILRSLTHSKGFSLIEQNFDFDLLTPQKLLEKYLGKTVMVIKRNPTTGKETMEKATVLATNNGVVLRIGDRIETGIPDRIAFSKVPANLRDRPTLVMQLTSGTDQAQSLELSYLTRGLSWKADYVAELGDKDKDLDLAGWVTLTNKSGTRYNNATLQLVAGDVNQVAENQGIVADAESAPRRLFEKALKVKQEGLFEYHLYTLASRTTLADKQTKQVSLLNAHEVPVRKELLFNGNDYYYMNSVGSIGQHMKVGVYLHFRNDKQSHLGIPLPKGVIRVYKKDRAGNAQFIGEDRIDHTPSHEEVVLKLGDSFDVTAKKRQTSFRKQRGFSPYNYVYTAGFEVVLKNAKDRQQIVKVREPIPGDWQVLKSNYKFRKTAAHSLDWEIPVPASGKATLRYRVRIKF